MKSLGNRFSQHSFAKIPSVNIARSRFDRSFSVKDTFDFDYLVPIFVDEILPGDTVNLNVSTFMRLATQVVPFLDRAMVDFYWFFVPNRLVWENWERFNGAQDNPEDSTDFLVPVVEPPTGGWPVNSVGDHFGIPINVEKDVNALPFRAYNLIWNEWFRDQNLQSSITVPKGDGPDDPSTYTLLKAAKKHDYFTSCLPWPQKGESIMMPLGLQAPVGTGPFTYDPSTGLAVQPLNPEHRYYYNDDGMNTQWTLVDPYMALNPRGNQVFSDANGEKPYGVELPGRVFQIGPNPEDIHITGGLYADLSNATAATINQFRQAIMMQSLLELDARGGTRYVEILKAHFGVVSPDFRLQRPEFLSSTTIEIQQHPVAQTSETTFNSDGDPVSPQANLAAFSTASASGTRIGFSKSFVEHGYVIGLARARGENTYQQGLNRLWSRQTRWDFFWPKLQELGEQAVLTQEIYLTGSPNDDEVFGYQERYAEYRYKPSEIRGQFRSTYSESLDVWHLAEEFGSIPKLNATFIQQNTPIERSLVVTEGYPHLLADFWFNYKHARPMAVYGVPASLGRF